MLQIKFGMKILHGIVIYGLWQNFNKIKICKLDGNLLYCIAEKFGEFSESSVIRQTKTF